MEVAVNLGVDPRHADQMVRGVVSLPHGTGKTLRVPLFRQGGQGLEALPPVPISSVPRPDGAGAKGSDRLRPLHRYAGHDGTRREAGQDTGAARAMPNPKVGTVTMDVGGAVKAAKAGQVNSRS